MSTDVRPVRSSELALVRELFLEYARSLGIDLEFQGFNAELAGLPGAYSPPRGCLLLAHEGDQVAGCVAVRSIGEGTCEMKRLYVRPAFRGLGLGRRLVEAAISAARAAKYAEMKLDTLPSMVTAQALYEQLGFRETAPYGDHTLPGTRFYSLRLDP